MVVFKEAWVKNRSLFSTEVAFSSGVMSVHELNPYQHFALYNTSRNNVYYLDNRETALGNVSRFNSVSAQILIGN